MSVRSDSDTATMRCCEVGVSKPLGEVVQAFVKGKLVHVAGAGRLRPAGMWQNPLHLIYPEVAASVEPGQKYLTAWRNDEGCPMITAQL